MEGLPFTYLARICIPVILFLFILTYISIFVFVIIFVFGRFAFHKETTSRSGQRTSNSSKRIEDMNFAIENTMLLNGGEDTQILEV